MKIQVDSNDKGQRLDVYLDKKFSDKSRSHIQKIIWRLFTASLMILMIEK